MSEPEEVKPSKPTPKYNLDLDKLSNTELKAVSVARNSAASQLANFKIAPGLAEAIKDFGSLGERMQSIVTSIPALPSFEPPKIPSVYDGLTDIDLTIPENPSYETNRLLRKLNDNVNDLKEQNAKLVAPNYDPKSCTIYFANKPIKLRKNTQLADLCNALFSEPGKKWDWDEMLERWGEHNYTKDDWRKVYEAARGINEKIAINTGVKDFLDYDKHTVMLNTAYTP